MESAIPVLYVCTACRAGAPLPEDGIAPGLHLHDALLRQARPGSVDIRAVTCLSACDHGCTATISAPGKWTYLIGRLAPAMAADVLTYAAAYAAAPTGTVMPSRRPASLARMVLGRMPGLGQVLPA